MLDKQQITNEIDATINHLDLITDELSTLGKPEAHELEDCNLDPEAVKEALAEGGASAEHLGAVCRMERAVKEIRAEMERLKGLRENVVGAFGA